MIAIQGNALTSTAYTHEPLCDGVIVSLVRNVTSPYVDPCTLWSRYTYTYMHSIIIVLYISIILITCVTGIVKHRHPEEPRFLVCL